MSSPKIAVIGAGISGLTVAYRLLQKGASPTVFDARSEAGGVIASERIQGFLIETAVNGFLSQAERGAFSLCKELGVPLAEAGGTAKNRWIFKGGKLRPLPTGLGSFVFGSFLPPLAKLRGLFEPLIKAGKADEESVAQLFRRRLGSTIVENLVDPFVTGIFAGDIEKLSAKSAFPRIFRLDKDGGFIRGRLKGRAANREEKKSERARGLAAPKEGMGAIVDALLQKLEGRVRYETAIVKIHSEASRPVVTCKDGTTEKFDAVVLAVPGYRAADIRFGDEEETTPFASIPYAPITAVHLGFRRQDISHSLDGYGFLVTKAAKPRMLGCLFESSIFSGRAPKDMVLIRCMYGGTRDPSVMSLSEAELFALAKKELASIVGVHGEAVLQNNCPWPNGIAQYNLGHGELVEKLTANMANFRTVLAGAAYFGVAVNDCVASADKAVDDALRFASLHS